MNINESIFLPTIGILTVFGMIVGCLFLIFPRKMKKTFYFLSYFGRTAPDEVDGWMVDPIYPFLEGIFPPLVLLPDGTKEELVGYYRNRSGGWTLELSGGIQIHGVEEENIDFGNPWNIACGNDQSIIYCNVDRAGTPHWDWLGFREKAKRREHSLAIENRKLKMQIADLKNMLNRMEEIYRQKIEDDSIFVRALVERRGKNAEEEEI